MYTHRTNLLLSEEEHQLLTYLAQSKQLSMGELIRQAIHQTYQPLKKKLPSTVDQKIVSSITANWGILKVGKKLDYKELINDGRKR